MARDDNSMMETLTAALAKLAETQAQLAALQTQSVESEKAKIRENPNYVPVSVFLKSNGEQWATDLKCEIYQNSIHLNKTPLTQAEVVALNRLQPVEDVRVLQNDGTPQIWRVEATKDAIGRLEKLTVRCPLRKEHNPNMNKSIDQWANILADAAEALTAA
jgi:type II secretory pathway component PulC